MAQSPPKKSAPFRWKRWLKILAYVCGILVVLLVIAYFVVTSSGFFKGVILPKVSKAVGATVTVENAGISPFSQVVLTGLKVQTTGDKPLLAAKEVRLRYSLWAILHGRILVDEVAIVSPVIYVVKNSDGTSNLDPLLKKSGADKTASKEKSAGASKPPQVDVKKITITHGIVRSVQEYAGGKSDLVELSDVSLSIDGIKNGQTAKLLLNLGVSVAKNPPDVKQAGLLDASVNGEFSFALTEDLNPASVTGGLQLNVSKATGALADLTALNAALQSEITPTEIKQVALRFQRGSTKLGEVFVSGPFDMAKTEGRFNVEIRSIDKQVLNAVGAMSGIDFGTTTLNSKNWIELAHGGQVITASGAFNVGKLQVTRAGQTTPTLDLNANYDVTVDMITKSALLRSLTVNGDQNSARLLHAGLTSPMNVAWSGSGDSLGDSTLNVALTGLNVADWKPFIGDLVSAGVVNADMKLMMQQGGKKLVFEVTSTVDNLAATLASNKISQAGISFTAHGQAQDLKQFEFQNYQLEVTRLKQSLLSVIGSGSYDLPGQSADMQIDLKASPANLLAAFPQPGATVQSGTVQLQAHVTQKQTTQTVNGTLKLADLTGHLGGNDFNAFASDINLDVSKTAQIIQLRQVAGKLSQNGIAGGSFSVSGQYDTEPAHPSGLFTLKLDGLNENAVRPFLEPLLADKRLVSVSINGNATAQYNPQGASSVKADVQVANLKVNDPKGKLPTTPLEAKLQLDTSLEKQIATVKQFQVTLTPTARGKNEVQLSGRVDMTKTNAFQGNLKLLADTLDLTSYYDLFAGPSKTATPSPTPAPAPASAQPETEPAAINLPFQNFVADVNIGRLYLREVEITNFQTSVKLDGGKILLKPFQLWINGAPVTALVDLNVGVPGYQYDVTLNADTVPLTPLVNSFQPDRKGQIGGTSVVKLQIKGAGITGAGLQKNLTGQFDVTSTNMNLAVVNVRNRLLSTIINTIVTIPELIRNPVSGLTDVASGALTGKLNDGWTGKMSSAPINLIELHGNAGSGIVNLQRTRVQSSAFQADATGTITLAPVLNDSKLKIPVTVSLERSLAEEIHLLPANTPTNAVYAQLPQFLTVGGTIGKAKADKDMKALLALAAVAYKAGGGAVNSILNAISGNTPTNAAPNNATQKPSKQEQQIEQIKNVIDLFGKPKK